jgi:4-hydroxymandelate oxidase
MGWIALRDLEEEATRLLNPAIADYIAGGADDEITTQANEAAYSRISLVPRVLCGAGDPDLTTELFRQRVSMPVLIAPTAFHRLVHAEGECATALAAAAVDTIMIMSMASTMALERVAAASAGRTWMQLYLQPDSSVTESLVRRAEDAGSKALVITVDSPVFGRRERDVRNGFNDLPPGLVCENLRESLNGEPTSRVRSIAFSTKLSWRDVECLRRMTQLKILLKGIAHPEDAGIAVECGVDGIFVSNHGGRQLDTIPATIELLPPIVDEVGGKVPVLVDGGIRRGTDVVKALALGATAVAVGRPVLWGLAVDGCLGVVKMLEALREEITRAIALCGCSSPQDLNRSLLHIRRQGEPWW